MGRYKPDTSKLILSKHFIDKWRERYGYDPKRAEIVGIIRESAWLQKCQPMQYPDGIPWVSAALFVHFDRNLALKVDFTTHKVLTLVDPSDMPGAKKRHRKGAKA